MKYKMLNLMLIFCLFWIIPQGASAASSPDFTLALNNDHPKVGETIQVAVSAKGITDLYGYEVNLGFDSVHLTYVSWTAPASGFSMDPIVSGNQLTFVHTKTGNVVGYNGNLQLGTITFKTKGEGNADVSLQSVKMVDSKLASTVLTSDAVVTAKITKQPVTNPNPDPNPNPEPEKDKDKDKEKNKETKIEIIVGGQVQDVGTAMLSNRDDQQVTTISIDQEKMDQRLAEAGGNVIITIPVNNNSDIVIGELTGQMVKNLANKEAVLEIKTEKATYKIPVQQMNIASISEQIGKSVALQDITIHVEIAAATADTVEFIKDAANKGNFTIVAPSIDFTVKATYGNQTVDVSKFNMYIERTIAIPDGVDPNKITTGIVIEPDGKVRHVPTKIVQIDGKYYAVINSLTNSTYSVVSHAIEFSDVRDHWSKQAVNSMGSRMVIEGTGDGLFSPDKDITRAEFAAIVVRGLGLKFESGATSFTDVKESDWYSSVIKTAVSNQLISGFEDGLFHPTDPITREQAMAIIAKAMAVTGLKAKLPQQDEQSILSVYTDGSESSLWAQRYVADCLQAGIIAGRSETTIAPKATITRAEVAAIIQRLLQKSNLI